MQPRVFFVSGGSRGLGAGLVAAFIEDGHAVATFSRKPSELTTTLGSRHPDRFIWEAIDSSDGAAVGRFVMATVRRFGRLDVAINNAGISPDGVLATMLPSEVRSVVSVNLESALFLAQAAAKVMLSQQSGVIVNISSIHGLRGEAGVAAYSATKAALDGLTRSLARELGPRGIRVNSIAPGYIATDMTHGISEARKTRIARRTPLQRLGRTEDVVSVARFLCSEGAAFMTGQTVVVDGGLTC